MLETEADRLSLDSGDATADLIEATQGVLATMEPLARARRARLSAVIPPDTPAVAMTRQALRHVLLSVVHYAMNRTGEGAVALAATPRGEGVPGGTNRTFTSASRSSWSKFTV
mgnify:CR=1 FL=1